MLQSNAHASFEVRHGCLFTMWLAHAGAGQVGNGQGEEKGGQVAVFFTGIGTFGALTPARSLSKHTRPTAAGDNSLRPTSFHLAINHHPTYHLFSGQRLHVGHSHPFQLLYPVRQRGHDRLQGFPLLPAILSLLFIYFVPPALLCCCTFIVHAVCCFIQLICDPT